MYEEKKIKREQRGRSSMIDYMRWEISEILLYLNEPFGKKTNDLINESMSQ